MLSGTITTPSTKNSGRLLNLEGQRHIEPKDRLRPEAGQRRIDGVGNHRRQDARHQRRVFVVRLAIQYRRAEQCPSQRRPKNRPDPGPRPDHQHLPDLRNGPAKHPAQQRSKTAADLSNRPFPARRTSRADRQGRSHRLNNHRDWPHPPLLIMKGVDHGIRAVSLGLRRKRVDQHARQQPSQRRQQHEHPGTYRQVAPGQRYLAAGLRGVIMCQISKEEYVAEVEGPHKDNGADARHNADNQAVEAPAKKIVTLYPLQKIRQSAERSRRPPRPLD